MTQPDFRQLLNNLLRLAKDAYEMRLEHFNDTGRDELPPIKRLPDELLPIKRLPDQPTNPLRRRKTVRTFPYTLNERLRIGVESIQDREAVNNYPFTQLGFAAHDVFRYPKSLWPASVTPSEETKELLNMLKFVGGDNEDRGENTKIDKLNRIIELTQSILDWKPIGAKEPPILVPKLPKTLLPGLKQPYDGGEFVFCVDENVRVPKSLREAMQAYLDGEPSIDVGASNPYQIQTRLKKLIFKLMNGGFEPAAKRWPKGNTEKGNVVYFASPMGKYPRKK